MNLPGGTHYAFRPASFSGGEAAAGRFGTLPLLRVFVVFGEAIETGCGGIHSQYTESRYLQGMRRGGFSVL